MQAPYNEDMTTQQQAPQQMQQQAPQEVDEVQMAKEALGLDAYEQQLQAMQAQLTASNQKAMMNEFSSKYEDVPQEEVEKKLVELEASNPNIRQDKMMMDMVFQNVKSQMNPTDKPDEITDSGDAGGEMGDFNKKLKDGNANEVDLGDFILSNS